MPSKKIQISIPKPCSEDWSNMTPTERGRFCAMCSKEVVDFTGMSKNETVDFIEKTPNLCGRFYINQLNNELNPNKVFVSEIKGFGWLDKLVAASLVLFTFNSLKAQSSANHSHTHAGINCAESKIDDSSKIEIPKSERLVIRGSVVDIQTQEPISYAMVIAQNTTAQCSADMNGHFELVLPESFEGDSLILLIKFVGYLEQEITVFRNDFSIELEVKLTELYPNVEPQVIGLVIQINPWKRFWWRMRFWKRRR